MFSKRVKELAGKRKVRIAFGLAKPDKVLLASLKKVSKYAEIILVGPEAIKKVRGFEMIIDKEPEKRLASMLAHDEIEGIVRGTIDDFKTAEHYVKLTGEKINIGPAVMETLTGWQFFLSPGSNPEGWGKEEKLELASEIASFAKKWGMRPDIAVFASTRHETYKRKKNIRKGIVGVMNKTYEDAEWMVGKLKKLGFKAKNWSIDLDLAIENGANIIIPVNGMVGNQIFRAILVSGGKVLAGPRITSGRPYEDNSRNEKDFSFHVMWLAAWINSRKKNKKTKSTEK